MPAHVQPPPASPAHSSLAARVEGWVQYCEYFHLLDADMQAREFPSPLPAALFPGFSPLITLPHQLKLVTIAVAHQLLRGLLGCCVT